MIESGHYIVAALKIHYFRLRLGFEIFPTLRCF